MTLVYGLAIGADGRRRPRGGASRRTSGSRAGSSSSAGSGTRPRSSATSLLVQRGAPDRVRGRAFTVIMGTNFAVLGLGMAMAGPLVDAVGRALGLGRSPGVDRASLARADRALRCSGASRLRPSPSPCHVVSGRGRATGRARALAAGVRAGDRRALARAITLVESSDPLAHELVRDLYPETGTRVRGRHHRPARRRQVEPDRRAPPPRPRPRPDRRRRLGRPLEPVLAGRAARRPDPAGRPLPRPGRLHPLDGHARPPRRRSPRRRSRRC